MKPLTLPFFSMSGRWLAVIAFASVAVVALPVRQGSADWKPSKMKPAELGRRAEAMYKTFKNVACGSELYYVAPDPTDPAGFGTGRALMNEYFWSPTVFRLEYMVYGAKLPGGWSGPTTEFVASDGKGKMMRLGRLVPPGKTKFSPKHGVFDVASDAQLVEAWPKQFHKYLLSPFAKGNATLTRYLSALSRGVGGYRVTVKERNFRVGSKPYKQYQVYAERPAKGSRPASMVEMVFDGAVRLPVTIHTTYGKNYRLDWKGTWLNNQKLPGDPFKIGVKN